MSWFNLNDKLKNITGELSNFATNVLADELKDSDNTDASLEEFKKICANQQIEIEQLKRINEEILQERQQSRNDGVETTSLATNWSWNVPENDDNDTKTIIKRLENEKHDLEKNIELLDIEYQQNSEKLISIKDRLQEDYSDLEEKYLQLQKDNEKLIADKKHQTTKICKKCENLSEENHRLRLQFDNIEKDKNDLSTGSETLKQIPTETQNSMGNELEEWKEKLKLAEAENKIVINELQKANDKIIEYQRKIANDAEDCQKLEFILEEYENQVSVLKNELAATKIPTETVEQKEEIHKKYVNILTETLKKYTDPNGSKNDANGGVHENDPHLHEFTNQVENILRMLVEFKTKCGNLEKDLYDSNREKMTILAEKNHEIEKLLQNSEVLSQEVITKTQTIKDYENECAELMKNNDILINELEGYKSNNGLQTISEGNEDNLLQLESLLENANKKIEDLENLTKHAEMLQDENRMLKDEMEKVMEDQSKLGTMVEKMRTDLENAEYQYTESNINSESLKEELELQKKLIVELKTKNNTLNEKTDDLRRQNENLRNELEIVREERQVIEIHIRNLNEKLQNAKMCETSLKLQYDTLLKELNACNEMKNVLQNDLCKCRNDYLQLQNDMVSLQRQIEKEEMMVNGDAPKEIDINDGDGCDLLENLKISENNEHQTETHSAKAAPAETDQSSQKQINEYSNRITLLEEQIEEAAKLRNQLEQTIADKQQLYINCRTELERINELYRVDKQNYLQTQTQLQDEIQRLQKQVDETIKEKQMFITKMGEFKGQIEKFQDHNNFLKEKCDILTQNLLQEQEKVKSALSERLNSSEKEQNLTKKLERLQSHLIEMEERYTQELLQAEEKNVELQTKMNELVQREKDSSTLYTSVSIRANQHVETLQNQLQQVINQRDELRKQISDYEDHSNKQAAALANLQFVLEQFQKDKEKDIQQETERIRRQINAEKQIQQQLRDEIVNLQAQLEEGRQGLQAASRLSDQLEFSKRTIGSLKDEASQLKEKLSKSEEKLQNITGQGEGKVDKSLIKNLVIGFITTNNNLNKDQMQILKIIGTVLDFNQQDHEKINKTQQTSWLASLLTPQPGGGGAEESLSQAFVRFLENESKPRIVPSLLDESSIAMENNLSTPRQSPSVLSEIVLPTFNDFVPNRNSSSILKDVLKDNN